MKGGTLFSGIGGPELACPGIDWRWCAEIDPFASAVLAARFPHSRNLGDVEKVDWDAVETVDIIVFGSPCQSFSVAGQRAGLDDPRGNLALVGLRAVDRIRPRWMVFENVPGLLSSDEGRDFGAFLGCLGQCGYGFAYRILDAQYFGVPQRRRRVFVVGHLGDWRGAAAVLFERESLRWNPAPRREAGEGVALPVTSRVDRGGGHREAHGNNLVAYGGNNTAGPIEVATACNAHGGPHGRIDFETETFVAYGGNTAPTLNSCNPHKGGGNRPPGTDADTADSLIVAHILRADGFDATEDGTGRGTPIIPILEVGARTNGDGYRDGDGIGNAGDPMYTLSGKQHAIAFHARQDDPDSGPVTHPLDTDGFSVAVAIKKPNGSSSNGARRNSIAAAEGEPMFTVNAEDTHGIFNGMSVRRLTPVECERLQGFPDGFTAIAYRGKPADGPRYRALGNAMAVPVIGWILRRVVLVDAIGNEVESGTLLAIK